MFYVQAEMRRLTAEMDRQIVVLMTEMTAALKKKVEDVNALKKSKVINP